MSGDDLESSSTSDPADSPFPACPRCGKPVATVTSTGPDTHYTSCGCRLTLGEMRRLRART